MMKIDFNKAFSSSMDYMSRILFKPFIFRKWLALGFVAMLAGFGSGGSGNGGGGNRASWKYPSTGRISSDIDTFFHQYLWLILLGIGLLIALGFLFTWLASVFKFVYTDQLIRNSMEIKEPFARLKGLGTSYFLWMLAYGLAFSLILRDFVITAMYVKNLRVMDAWRTVMPTIKANMGQIVLYLLMLIVISIASAIISIFGFIIAVMIIIIPVGILAGICLLIALAASLVWNTLTIAAVSVLGLITLFAFSWLLVCLMQPLLVFRRVFSLKILGQLDPELETLDVVEPVQLTPQEPIS